MSNDIILYDLETKRYADEVDGGWNNIYGMGLSTGVTWSANEDRYRVWTEKQINELCSYLNGNKVVSFNGISFDSILLLGNDRKIDNSGTTSNEEYSWYNYDIYVEMWSHILNMVGKPVPEIMEAMRKQRFPKNVFNLDSIAQNTLGFSKTGKGVDAPKLYKEKKFVELIEYNLQDVRVLKKLYRFLKERKYLVNGNYDIVKF